MRQVRRPGLFCSAAAAFLLVAGTLEAEIVQKCLKEADGFSIEFPQGWELVENPTEEVSLVAVRPEEKAGESIYERVEVRVLNEPGEDLDAFLQRHIANLQDNLSDFTPVSGGSEEMSGRPARFLVYTFTDSFFTLKVLAKAKQWIIPAAGRTYLITLAATVESFPKYEPAFDEIAGSFRYLK